MTKSDGNVPPKFGAKEYLKEMYPKPKFICKHCGSGWETKKSCRTHETWCSENPDRRGYTRSVNPIESIEKKEKVVEKKEKPIYEMENRIEEFKEKFYTIEEIRELDNVINLSDKQIARLVRGKNYEN